MGFGAIRAGNSQVVRQGVWGIGLLEGCLGFQVWGALQEAGGEASVCLPAPSRVLALNLLHFSLRGMDQQQIANNPKYLTVHMQVVALVCAVVGLQPLEYDI